jgi:hypothetical protein
MEKIPTAEEFFRDIPTGSSDIEYWAKEFTRLHVKAALETAAKKATINWDGAGANLDAYVNEKSILNAYPLTNIE